MSALLGAGTMQLSHMLGVEPAGWAGPTSCRSAARGPGRRAPFSQDFPFELGEYSE